MPNKQGEARPNDIANMMKEEPFGVRKGHPIMPYPHGLTHGKKNETRGLRGITQIPLRAGVEKKIRPITIQGANLIWWRGREVLNNLSSTFGHRGTRN